MLCSIDCQCWTVAQLRTCKAHLELSRSHLWAETRVLQLNCPLSTWLLIYNNCRFWLMCNKAINSTADLQLPPQFPPPTHTHTNAHAYIVPTHQIRIFAPVGVPVCVYFHQWSLMSPWWLWWLSDLLGILMLWADSPM